MEQIKKFNDDYLLSNADSIRIKLKNYRSLVSNLKSLSDMYQELFCESYLKAQVIDNMPKGDCKSDPTSKYALTELIPKTQQRLFNDIKELDDNISEILNLINCPALSSTQRIILKTKYIDGVKWEYMSYKLSEKGIYYSKTRIQSLHDRAINKLNTIF